MPTPTASAAARPPSTGRLLWLLFAVISLANAWPFAAYEYPPLMDYPSHLFRAQVISQFHNPSFDYAANFRITPRPTPNSLGDYLTVGLSKILPLRAAGKLVAALAVAMLPLAVWFWIGAVAPGRQWWALAAVPLSWSYFLLDGNINFSLSAVLVFLLWGILARWDGTLRPKVVVPTAGLMLLIFTGHALVFALACLVMLGHLVLTRPRSLSCWIAHGIIVVPGGVLAAIWVLSGSLGGDDIVAYVWNYAPTSKAWWMARAVAPGPWNFFQRRAWLIGAALAFLGYALWRAGVGWKQGSRFAALVPLTCFASALATTDSAGTAHVDGRLWWLGFLASLALLPALRRRAAIGAGLAIALVAAGTNLDQADVFARSQAGLESVEKNFSRMPRGLRLAYIAPINISRALHRCFEYYHITHGGVGPYHLMGNAFTVGHKDHAPPKADIYAFGVQALGPWLDSYDAVLILADQDTPDLAKMLEILKTKGYRQVSPAPFTMLMKPAPGSTTRPAKEP